MYRSLVHTILEYRRSVWQPHHKLLFKDVEGIQQHATRLLSRVKDKSNSDRLRHLNLLTLEHLEEEEISLTLTYHQWHLPDQKTKPKKFTLPTYSERCRSSRKGLQGLRQVKNKILLLRESCGRIEHWTASQRTWSHKHPVSGVSLAHLDAHWKNLPSIYESISV